MTIPSDSDPSQALTEDFKLALEAAPSGMLVVRPDGRIAFASRLARQLFGADDLEGRSVDQLVPEAQRAGHADHRATFAAEPSRRAMGQGRTLSARRLDGSAFPVEIGLNPLEQDGQTWVVCSVVDISLRVERERRTQEAERKAMESQRLESLGLLAGGLAHDFNNLLVGVIGNARLALDHSRESMVQECLEDVLVAADQAAVLARQMLAYSGQGQFVVQDTDISKVVEDVTPLLRSTVPRSVELRVRTAGDLPLIEADAAQLRQVLLNLVNNALDAIGRDESGTIRLTTGRISADATYLASAFPDDREPGEYVYIDVSDTGCGMSEALKRRVFEPFFTTKSSGHGLGLAATLGIVRAHRGAVVVYSEEGQGTRMHVLFPVSSAHDVVRERACLGTILLADDDAVVRRFAIRALTTAGYRTIEAEDGEEALRRVREDPAIDVVVMDMSMPRMGGLQALRQLREAAPGLPVVLMSGYSVETMRDRIDDVMPDAFLQKPFVSSELMLILRDLRAR